MQLPNAAAAAPAAAAGAAADGAADDAANDELSFEVSIDELLRAPTPPSTPIVVDDDDDMLGGGTVGGVRVGDLAAELEKHPITTDDLDEMAGFVEIADGLDPYWPMRELEIAAGLVELPELEAAFDAMEVEVDTAAAAATDAAAMVDGFFA